MHSEIRQDVPGLCPKCGMALVKEDMNYRVHKTSHDVAQVSVQSFVPLIVILSIIIISALLLSSTTLDFIVAFMAGFFIVFGGFKLLDLKGFVDGYSTYDLIASRARIYAYFYPFIELAFGFSMLVGYHPDWVLGLEILVMTVSGIGVVSKLAKGEAIQCVCLGTTLKLPLTYVTLLEDFGMAILALVLLAVY